MLIRKVVKSFAGVKPLSITAATSTSGLKAISKTNKAEWEITNPLEALLGSLVACEQATAQSLTHSGSFKVKSFKFNRVESSLDLQKFMKGGKDSKINEVFIEAEVETNGTQADLNELHKKVENSCPVYQMLSQSGVKINNKWTNVKSS